MAKKLSELVFFGFVIVWCYLMADYAKNGTHSPWLTACCFIGTYTLGRIFITFRWKEKDAR